MTAILRIVPEAPAAVSPILKWAGGKRWFVKQFGDEMFRRVLERGGRYIEPFLGGASMALHLGLTGTMLGDINEELIATYWAIQNLPKELATYLALLEEQGTDREAYYRIRATKPQTVLDTAARTIYLNKLCFNGLYRKNGQGKFNVPYGGSRKLPGYEQILAVSRALAGADLRCSSALELIDDAGARDVVYADPPYDGTFADYTEYGFDSAAQEKLAGALQRAHQRGAEVYAHNADTERVRELYRWAEIRPLDERRSINRGPKQGCVLIVASRE